MIHVINDSLLNAKQYILVQQVNCKGVMGAGLAKTIRTKYPNVYTEYKRLCNSTNKLIGRVQVIAVDNHAIANFFAQDTYGRTGIHTDYRAFELCCRKLNRYCLTNKITTIAMPYGIGCGLAGGDWDIITKLIEANFNIDVYLYKI